MDQGRIRIAPLSVDDKQGYDQVLSLGDRFRDRLGQLPYAAFADARDDSRLLVATDQESAVIGYALYRLPRNEVSLTHLCVEPDARGTGIARALVDEITHRHSERLGIRAKCRDDYSLDDTWTGLGFRARATTVGRGRDQAAMTVWWKDHGHPDLFTDYELPVELRAAIDLNIVRDLMNPEKRDHRSDFLVADHLADRLQLVVSSGMIAEINTKVRSLRTPLIEEISRYPTVHAQPHEAEEIRQAIVDEVRKIAPKFPVTDQDANDVTQVAHAAAAGLSVFLTWDDGIVNRIGPAVKKIAGIKLMRPPYVVVQLDELANAEAFRANSLAGSSFTYSRAGTDLEVELEEFTASTLGERPKDLRKLISEIIKDGHIPQVVRDEDSRAVALYCTHRDGKASRVPLIRLTDHVMSDTLARHLLWTFRLHARDAGASMVEIADPYLSHRLNHAAGFDALHNVGGRWYAPVVNVCGTASEVAAAAVHAFATAGLPRPPLLQPGLSSHAAARIEHAWWPAKIIDSELPTYAVPIRSNYAYELFGYPEGLSPRNPQLSLGREHVYYHSVVNSQLTAPARILWLSTGDGQSPGQFFAASILDGLTTDSPQKLHEDLSYYGVFNQNAVIAAAMGQDRAEALRISDTEIFHRPLSIGEYRRQRDAVGVGPKANAFMSAQRIPSALFAALYRTAAQ